MTSPRNSDLDIASVKSFTSQVSDGSRHLRTPTALSVSPSPPMTSPRNSDLDIASAPRTRSSSTSLTGRSHPSLKSDQFSFAFMPLAEGRDPSTSNPVPGRPTPPPAPSHPSCPKFSPRPFSCPYSRPRDTPACIKHSPRPLRTPCNSSPGLHLFQTQSLLLSLIQTQTTHSPWVPACP